MSISLLDLIINIYYAVNSMSIITYAFGTQFEKKRFYIKIFFFFTTLIVYFLANVHIKLIFSKFHFQKFLPIISQNN